MCYNGRHKREDAKNTAVFETSHQLTERENDNYELHIRTSLKLLSKLQQEYNGLDMWEENSKTFLASVGEDVESARPEYDYEKMREQFSAIENKIRKVKHAINIFNTTTLISEFNMTVDEMLVYLPQLSRRKAKLTEMATTLPKARYRSGERSNIIDYKYANYDIDKVKEDLEKITEELSKAQLALDLVNHTKVFCVDI